jgi:acyl-CoA synthetase (AMP-forming)/AMP-acid ligase II/acyl carrier protein
MLNRSESTPDATYFGDIEAQPLRADTTSLNPHFSTPHQENKLIPSLSQSPALRCPTRCDASSPPVIASLIDLLRARASVMGDKRAFTYLRGDGTEEASVSYRGLHERAMAIGAELQSMTSPGDRAMLLFPAGLEFVEAFFGCLYAGVVAVPAAPPGRNRSTSSADAIFDAATPSLILSTAEYQQQAAQSNGHFSKLLQQRWVATDRVASERHQAWRELPVDRRQIAFLQYTSGSTSSPKGVILSHKNLLYNSAVIQRAFGNTSDSSAVFWLPLYHDMGLIGGVIQPIYCGGSCTLLAPAAFLQRPALWLETISRARATISGGPNFAFDLCARKVSAKERAGLDLDSWKVAFVGAEQIRAQTLERFVATFAQCGFRREAFLPCYGLAEATLMVSGSSRSAAPTVVHVSSEALARNRVHYTFPGDSKVRSFVGCGRSLSGQRVMIVDPEASLPCEDGSVGEIWIQGPSVAEGYYERSAATAAVFRAHLANNGHGPFLRSGDLGFVRNHELFVTGRVKDLIIVRGRNYYPEDIEHTVDHAYDGLRAGYGAAFSVDLDGRDRLVIVQEVEPRRRDLDTAPALRAIRLAVVTRHELEVYAIALVKAGAVPKTSSGKTRRSACRERYLNGQLEVLAAWKSDSENLENVDVAENDGGDIPAEPSPRPASAAEIESWLIQQIAARLRLTEAEVGVTTPFLQFGMGSLDAVEIAAALERWLARRLSPTAIYNYPNIAALAYWLANPPLNSATPAASQAVDLAAVELDPQRLLQDVRQMSEQEMHAFVAAEMAKQEGK